MTGYEKGGLFIIGAAGPVFFVAGALTGNLPAVGVGLAFMLVYAVYYLFSRRRPSVLRWLFRSKGPAAAERSDGRPADEPAELRRFDG